MGISRLNSYFYFYFFVYFCKQFFRIVSLYFYLFKSFNIYSGVGPTFVSGIYSLFHFFLNLGRFLAHLVPLGTPYALIPFMVVIELVRRIIRPLTLSVRLAANIVAGHLLMVLVSRPITSIRINFMALVISALLLLIMLELAVSFIQAYVFSTLISLYVIEVNSPNL